MGDEVAMPMLAGEPGRGGGLRCSFGARSAEATIDHQVVKDHRTTPPVY